MSVNYSAMLVYGWEMTSEEHEAFNEASKYKYEDDFVSADSYWDPELYVFGNVIHRVSPGFTVDITDIVTHPDTMLPANFGEYFHNAFAEAGWEDWENNHLPTLLLVCQVS